MNIKNTIICPGCGLILSKRKLKKGACPSCGWENGVPPYRLLTIGEWIENKNDTGCLNPDLSRFLTSLFQLIKRKTLIDFLEEL